MGLVFGNLGQIKAGAFACAHDLGGAAAMEENGSSCSRILCEESRLIEFYGVRVDSSRWCC
jgi:hypothetical protein